MCSNSEVLHHFFLRNSATARNQDQNEWGKKWLEKLLTWFFPAKIYEFWQAGLLRMFERKSRENQNKPFCSDDRNRRGWSFVLSKKLVFVSFKKSVCCWSVEKKQLDISWDDLLRKKHENGQFIREGHFLEGVDTGHHNTYFFECFVSKVSGFVTLKIFSCKNFLLPVGEIARMLRNSPQF